MKKTFFTCCAVALTATMSGCFWDKESVLYPQGQCDTASAKWTTTVQPVIQRSCAYVGCHAGASPGGGINLASYAGVKAIADDGSLLGAIEHTGNYSFMPQNGSKLPDCEISQIRIWVNGGAQQN